MSKRFVTEGWPRSLVWRNDVGQEWMVFFRQRDKMVRDGLAVLHREVGWPGMD
jgi:hypothetical protein